MARPSYFRIAAALAAIATVKPELDAPSFCHDCGRRFEWDDSRTIIGDRAYHSDTCGPAPEPND